MDEDRIKKNALNAMITCSVIAVISVIAFIFIVIFDPDKSDIPLFGALFGMMLIASVLVIIKYSKEYKEPGKVLSQHKTNNKVSVGFYNAEWNWDVAEANYRAQYNKTGALTEQDHEVIWKYCAAEISYVLMWIIDRNFINVDPSTEALITAIRRREKTPDEFMECIDMKLTEDDVSDKIWPFIEYYYSDGFESIDGFFERVSKSKTNILPDIFTEKENRHCNFAFDWKFYDEFKMLLDKEYKDYCGE